MKLLFIFVLTLCAYAECAKILAVCPFPSKSHHILVSALLKGLAAKEHEVTMVSPYPLKDPLKNYHDVDLKLDFSRKENYMKVMTSDEPMSWSEKYDMTTNMLKMLSRDVLENEHLQAFLATKPKFDIYIHMLAVNEALLGIGHAVNATPIYFSLIGGSPFINYHTSMPTPYAYVPSGFGSFSDNMNFIERTLNTLSNVLMDILLTYVNLPYQRGLLKEFFPNAPPLEELLDNVDLSLINSHIATESGRPYLPNVIQIGGYHLQEQEALPADIKKYLDESKNGVILFSLGSNVNSADLPQTILDDIFNTFRKLPYDILWKFEAEFPNIPKNVKISKWLPQRAVLGHKNVKAFITHGGLGSTVESIYHGVPMICIPLFGDQKKNVADTVAKGYGVHVDFYNITEKTFTYAINEVIKNPIYKHKATLKSDIYKNQPINPMDHAVYWVEHVVKHKGAKHLKSRAAEIPLYQYLLLDVIAFMLLCSTIATIVGVGSIYVSFKLVKKICKKKCNAKNAQKNVEKKTQ